MRTVRRSSALLLASAVLFGLPYVLLFQLSWPQLDLTWQNTFVHLRSLSAPPGLAMTVLMGALWGVWALYAAALAAELAARFHGGGPWIRPLGPLQVIAATAIGASIATPTTAAVAETTHVQQEVEQGEPQVEEPARESESAENTHGAPMTPVADPGESAERSRTVAGFGFGATTLTEPMRQDLSDVADLVRDFGAADTPIRVIGHTDPSGPDDINRELSEQRAESAAEYLRDQLGEDAPTIEVKGVGSKEQRDGDAKAQRRVEVAYQVFPETTTESKAPSPEEDTQGADDEVASDAAAAPVSVAEDDGEGDPSDSALASAEADDGSSVVVLEVPDGAATAGLVLAGIVGGYAVGRKGLAPSRIQLSLPRVRGWLNRRSPRALPPAPARPTPSAGIDPRVTVELDHVPGVGLTGEGARAAVRRLVVNALGDNALHPARILMTGAQAIRLLGPEASTMLRAHPCEPVLIVDSMEQALERMRSELHERANTPHTADGRPLILVTENDKRHETALAGLLLHGQRNGISAVVIGRWPLGGNCEVAADGLITQTSTPLQLLHHASWPGSEQEEVAAAVRAYRHSRPALVESSATAATAAAVEGETTAVEVSVGMESGDSGTPATNECVGAPHAVVAVAPTGGERATGDNARTDRVLDLLGFTSALAAPGPGGSGAAPAMVTTAGDGKTGEADVPLGVAGDHKSPAAPAPEATAVVTDEAAQKATETETETTEDADPVDSAASGDGGTHEPLTRPEQERGEESVALTNVNTEAPHLARRERAAETVSDVTGHELGEEPVTPRETPKAGVGSVGAVGPVSPLPHRTKGVPTLVRPGAMRAGGEPAQEPDARDAGVGETGVSESGAGGTSVAEIATALRGLGWSAASGPGETEGSPAVPRPSVDPTPSTDPAPQADATGGDADTMNSEVDGTQSATSGKKRSPERRTPPTTARAERVRRMRIAKAQAEEASSEKPAPRPGSGGEDVESRSDSPSESTPERQDGPPSTGSSRSSSVGANPAQEPECPEAAAEIGAASEPDTRRLPRKPRKAGRGRNWRPRETT